MIYLGHILKRAAIVCLIAFYFRFKNVTDGEAYAIAIIWIIYFIGASLVDCLKEKDE